MIVKSRGSVPRHTITAGLSSLLRGAAGASPQAVGRRREASQPRTPSTPTVVPMAREAAMSRACTHRKLVGLPSPTVPADHARGSFQMATANLGQITQVQTPTPTRNSDQPRDNTMAGQYASGPSAQVRSAGTGACGRSASSAAPGLAECCAATPTGPPR
uniref:GntT-like protein n=1 Tax=Micromonospora chersina TaxID=47854 RepID=B2BM20_9ACTN|nr:GntT-like protein [Micromonospora chersina]